MQGRYQWRMEITKACAYLYDNATPVQKQTTDHFIEQNGTLETAIAQAVKETSSFLSTQIVRDPDAPSVFHSEFDNFDQLLNNLTGIFKKGIPIRGGLNP